MSQYPDDEDGEVLKKLADSGIDMDSPLNVEFMVHSPNEASSTKIVNAMNKAGYETEIDFDEGELEEGEEQTKENEEFWPSWTVYAQVKIVPEYNIIIRIQNELDKLAEPFGGKSDGWGVLN